MVNPKTVRREPTLGDGDLRGRLRALAAERRRFGYRRLGILLRREGVAMNKKKPHRLYREEGLSVRRRRGRGRKRATGTRAPLALPQGPNQRWSLDFVADALAWAAASPRSIATTAGRRGTWPAWIAKCCWPN